MTDLQRRELDQTLWRDLEALVRAEAEAPLPLVPRRFEVSFGSERSPQELQRGLDLGADHALREDRPDRRRPVQRARDRHRLQVRQGGALGGGDREGAAAPDPAVHARAPRSRRHRAARRACTGRSPARARCAGCCARRRARTSAGLRRATTTSTTRLLGARRGGARAKARGSPCASRRATCATTRRATSARPGATSGPSAGSAAHELASRIRSSRRRSRLAARCSSRPAQAPARRPCWSSASSRAVCDDGLDVDSILVITYTRKAAAELRARIRAALIARGRPDSARALDGAWISTIHGFCNRLLRAYPFAAGLDPRFRELDEAQAAVLRSEAFDEALAAFCAGGEPERLRLLVAYGGARLRGMLIGVYETLRAAGRELVLELGEAAPLERAGRGAPRGRALPRGGRGATEPQRATRRRARSCSTPAAARPAARPGRVPRRRRARGELRGGAEARRAGGARPIAAARPRAAPGAARALRRGVLGGEGARVGARLRGSPARGARPAPRPRGDPRARAAPLPLADGRRVPGHEPPAVRARRPARGRARRARAVLRRRRVPVDLRLPARRRGRVPRAARARRRRARADAELPLAAGGARRRQLPLRRGVRRRVPAARGLGRLPRSGLRPPGRAARHRQGELRRHRRALAARRGAAHRAARARARRRGRRRGRARSCCCSPPARTPSGTRRSSGAPACRPTARPAAATSASSRSSTCSPTCVCSTTATTTRRS